MKTTWKILREILNTTLAKIIVALLAALGGGTEVVKQVDNATQQ